MVTTSIRHSQTYDSKLASSLRQRKNSTLTRTEQTAARLIPVRVTGKTTEYVHHSLSSHATPCHCMSTWKIMVSFLLSDFPSLPPHMEHGTSTSIIHRSIDRGQWPFPFSMLLTLGQAIRSEGTSFRQTRSNQFERTKWHSLYPRVRTRQLTSLCPSVCLSLSLILLCHLANPLTLTLRLMLVN